MEFRGVAFIALWTMLSGPIFGGASGTPSRSTVHCVPVVVSPEKSTLPAKR